MCFYTIACKTGRGSFHLTASFLLQCVNLPNMDVGGFLGNKTDAFCAVVYEDTCEYIPLYRSGLDPLFG